LSRFFDDLWIEVGLKENITIGVIYRHPHNDINVFQESFMQTLHKLTVNKKNMYDMGDFNIDLLKASNNHDLLNQPTRVTHSLVDHICTNDSKHRMNSACLWDISDHCSYFVLFLCPNLFTGYQRALLEICTNLALKIFFNELQKIHSSRPISQDVNSSLSTLLFSFENGLNKHAPK